MVHDGQSVKGRSNDAIASACLYIACRQEGVPRTFREICAVSKISKKEIGRCFRLILKVGRNEFETGRYFTTSSSFQLFNIDFFVWLISQALGISVDLITTDDFMPRFCSNLALPRKVQEAATTIARRSVDYDIVPGRSPIYIAAAAIYMASLVNQNQNLTVLTMPNATFNPNYNR